MMGRDCRGGARPRGRGGSRATAVLLSILGFGCAPWEHSLTRAPFIIHTNGEAGRLPPIAARAAFICGVYEDLFGLQTAALGPLEIIDTVPAGEVRVGTLDPGSYEGRSRRIVLRDTPDDELLLHEIAHHFIRGLRERTAPWINEGLAVYLAWSAVGEEEIAPGGLPIHHVQEVVELAACRRLRPLSVLTGLRPADFYTEVEEQRTRNYSEAWAAVYFLVEEALPREPMPRRLRSLLAMTPSQVAALEERYERFWRKFDILAELKSRLSSSKALERHLAAILLGIVGDPHAIPPLMHLASKQDESRSVRLAALRGVGTILLQIGVTDFTWGEDQLRDSLQRLMGEEDPAVAELSTRLRVAVRTWDRGTFLTEFAIALVADPVYPSRTYARMRKPAEGPSPRAQDL
ncbi:MAG: hypothetical protein AB1486_15895 [Planctomycetota bacterium]